MPVYPFACQCGHTTEIFMKMADYDPNPWCEACGAVMQRTYTPPALPKVFVPHWNPSVGQYVSSQREFDQALSRGSDEASERLGMEHRYRRVDPDEAKAGVDDQGMEATRRKRRELGLDQPKSKIVS